MIILGEKLKQIRNEKNLTLEDVSKSTKIKEEFLDFIEKGEYEKLPSATHAQGFVRNYAKFLDFPEKEATALFRREFDSDKSYKVLPRGFEAKEEFPIHRFKAGQTIVVFVLILVIFLGYILFQYRSAFLDPSLYIIYPKNNSIVNRSEITVFGRTEVNATVYVNDSSVAVDQNGNFQKIINVFPGKTTIDIKAVNKFLRQTEKKIEVDVKASS